MDREEVEREADMERERERGTYFVYMLSEL